MSELTERIARQSRTILILAKVARIVLFVVIFVTAFLAVVSWIPESQPIFKLGKIEVYATLPLKSLMLSDESVPLAQSLSGLRLDLAVQLAAFLLAQVMLSKITRLFTLIRDNKDPFTADIAKPMKAMAILLGLVIGVENTVLGVVVAFVVFAFALIFQYGAELQNQVDETL